MWGSGEYAHFLSDLELQAVVYVVLRAAVRGIILSTRCVVKSRVLGLGFCHCALYLLACFGVLSKQRVCVFVCSFIVYSCLRITFDVSLVVACRISVHFARDVDFTFSPFFKI